MSINNNLENIECPQFVDFMQQETFDMNDGADFEFGLFLKQKKKSLKYLTSFC